MNKNKFIENQYYSYNLGELPKGCQFCVRGEKLVLFVTGLCPRKCYFCPLSDLKYGQEGIFANEKKIILTEEALEEAKKMQAKGAGITGGDPLVKLERTCHYIKKMKETFGKGFHIHLYTSLCLVNEDVLQQLSQAGLDEIRFHPDLDFQQSWKRIELAQKFPWDLGVEIPLIPGKEKETTELIDFVADKVHFLNLNELEVADNQQSKLLEMGFVVKDELSYAVKGSLEMGLNLLEYVQERYPSFRIHLCTAKLKDAIQLSNRLKREAQGSKKKFDEVDEEGLLTRGALYLPELAPGFEYRKKLAEINKQELVEKLKELREKIIAEAHLKEKELFLDEEKPRLLLSRQNLLPRKKMFLKLGLMPAIVIEYPTADQLEIEVEFLR